MSLGMKKVKKFEKIEIHKMFLYDFPDLLEWRKFVFEGQNQLLNHLKVRKKKFKKEKKQVDSNPRPPARHPTPQPRRQPTLDFYSLAGEWGEYDAQREIATSTMY